MIDFQNVRLKYNNDDCVSVRGKYLQDCSTMYWNLVMKSNFFSQFSLDDRVKSFPYVLVLVNVSDLSRIRSSK